MGNAIRLDKLLCELALGSRSDLKKQIRQGLATVNGEVEISADRKINPDTDHVCFRGKPVEYEGFEYYLLNKPAGYVTARKDHRYPVVMDLVPSSRTDLSPVGRLDVDTTGLLLITNDGALSHRLLSPSRHIKKTYFAVLDMPVPPEAAELFAQGIDIGDDKPTLPAELCVSNEDKRSAFLTITEGRYHQVKRMFAKMGCTVIELKRTAMGGLTLNEEELPQGSCRKLTPEEIAGLEH